MQNAFHVVDSPSTFITSSSTSLLYKKVSLVDDKAKGVLRLPPRVAVHRIGQSGRRTFNVQMYSPHFKSSPNITLASRVLVCPSPFSIDFRRRLKSILYPNMGWHQPLKSSTNETLEEKFTMIDWFILFFRIRHPIDYCVAFIAYNGSSWCRQNFYAFSSSTPSYHLFSMHRDICGISMLEFQ